MKINEKSLIIRLTFLLNRLWSLSGIDHLSQSDKAFLTGEIKREVLKRSKKLSLPLEVGFSSSLKSKSNWEFFRENTISGIIQ